APVAVTYVVSTRVEKVWPFLELDRSTRFKLDPSRDWSDDVIDRLAERRCVDTADFKGVFRGDFGQPPDPSLYRRIAEAFPQAWLVDPGLGQRTNEGLGPPRRRGARGAPVRSEPAGGALPVARPRVTMKLGRLG